MTLLHGHVDILYCSLYWINKRYESVTQSIVHKISSCLANICKEAKLLHINIPVEV